MFMFDSGSSSDLGAAVWSGALRFDLEEIWAHWCLAEVFSIFTAQCVWIMMLPLCHQIITALEEDSTAQKMQLGYRLQQIAAAVENKVTDLWRSEQDYWERAASPELNSCSWTTGRSWWTEWRRQNSHLQSKCVEEEEGSASICSCRCWRGGSHTSDLCQRLCCRSESCQNVPPTLTMFSADRHGCKIFKVYFKSEISELNWVDGWFYSGTANMFWYFESLTNVLLLFLSWKVGCLHLLALGHSCLPLSGCTQAGGQQAALLRQSCDVTCCSLLQLVPGGGEGSCCFADGNRTEFYFNISE